MFRYFGEYKKKKSNINKIIKLISDIHTTNINRITNYVNEINLYKLTYLEIKNKFEEYKILLNTTITNIENNYSISSADIDNMNNDLNIFLNNINNETNLFENINTNIFNMPLSLFNPFFIKRNGKVESVICCSNKCHKINLNRIIVDISKKLINISGIQYIIMNINDFYDTYPLSGDDIYDFTENLNMEINKLDQCITYINNSISNINELQNICPHFSS